MTIKVLLLLITLVYSGQAQLNSICNYVYDNTTMDTSPPSNMMSSSLSFILATADYPDWSTDGQCSCHVTARSRMDVVLNMSFSVEGAMQEGQACSAVMLLRYSGHDFFVCSQSQDSKGQKVTLQLHEQEQVQLQLYNPGGMKLMSHIAFLGSENDVIVNCTSRDIRLTNDLCPCGDVGSGNTGQLIPVPHSTPKSKRLMVGFLAAFGFVLLVGIMFLLMFLIKRGYIKGFGPLNNCRKEQKEKEMKKPPEEHPPTFARNLGFLDDSPAPKDKKDSIPQTPQNKNSDGIYATIGQENEQTVLPFTPDPDLRLDLKTPADCEVGSKYRGSVDSGLYSEISNDKLSRGVDTSFPGPYATSVETLQALGPEFKFEPPAGQSSPKPPPRSKEEIEALYAKPNKPKKKKKKVTSKESVNNDTTVQSLQDAKYQISIENLPEYYPRPVGSRSGSANKITEGQEHLSHSKSGSANVLYLSNPGSSRSENELHMTDPRNDSYGSRGTISTDV